jgi:hypothetical protein
MQVAESDPLRSLLRELASDDRILLECRIVEGWHYVDIAVRLDVPRDVLVDRVRSAANGSAAEGESARSPRLRRRRTGRGAPAARSTAGLVGKAAVATRTAEAVTSWVGGGAAGGQGKISSRGGGERVRVTATGHCLVPVLPRKAKTLFPGRRTTPLCSVVLPA